MKSWFLRITAVFMAVILCVAMSACGKDDAGEESSSAFGQAASGEGNSTFAGNSTPVDPILPPDAESIAQPVGGGGDDTPGTLPNVSVTQGKPGSTAGKTTQQNNQTTTERETTSNTVNVTFPEHYNIIQIANVLEAKGVCNATEFINTAQTGNFSSFTYVKNMPIKKNRAFKLEGYLFPETYNFYKNMKPEAVIKKILTDGGKILNGFQSQVAGSGLKNMDEVLTLASIVEREAKTNTDKNMVAGIFLNRLKKGMKLEADATRDYCINFLRSSVGKYKNLNQPYMEYAYVYNTYNSTCPGLPAGPICNPGRSSIRAVLNPTKTDALFFCYGKDPNNSNKLKLYTAVTDAEHEQNKKLAGLT